MKAALKVVAFFGLSAPVQVSAQTTPVAKVLQLLTDLASKVTADGEHSKALYAEFSVWCEDRAANLGFEIGTGESQVAQLKATIDQETATITTLSSKVDQLSSDVATDEADLKAATDIRSQESADFSASEKELSEVIDTLKRAISVLEREARKGGAMMVQLKNAGSLTQALSIMIDASMLNAADADRLTALVQNSQNSDDSDLSLGAPASAVYESHSGSIIQTLEDLLDKAEDQLSEARKKETSDLHNFERLKQSLQDEIKFATKDFNEAKQGIAAAGESKSAAEGDLAVTSKELGSDKDTLGTLHHDCTTKAQDYEAEVKSRNEELKALAEAKKVIEESTGGAVESSYSLLQVSRVSLTSGVDLAHFEAVRFVRDLARKLHAPALSQLAARMATAVHSGARDPFAKVKGLISDLIKRLEEEAGSDASHKAYCDKELAEAGSSKEEKSTVIEKLSTKIDQMSARSAQLKQEIAAVQSGLASLAKSQAESDKQRQSEHELYVTERANLEQGLQGVKLALKVLRDYYGKADKAHSSGEGAATGIIGLIEVVESDFSKGLAETIASEESAQSNYDQQTKENEIEKAAKDQDVKYKTAESVNLDKAVAETTSDRSNVQSELDAVLEYFSKLEEQCIAKAEPYAERAQRRADEINGLKQALEILEGEAVLIQTSRRGFKGLHVHPAK